MAIYLLIIGFISILGQVIILRELNTAFFGIELIYILALGTWLLGTALGVMLDRRSKIISINTLNIFFLAWGIIFLIDIYFIRSIRVIFGESPGTYLQFANQFAGIVIAVLPVSAILGLLFRHAARIYIAGERTLAKAYALESAGGVIGGLTSTLLLKLDIQNYGAALICCLISLALVFYSYSKNKIIVKLAAVLFLAALFLLLIFSSSIDFEMTKINHPNLVETKDTPYGRVSITSLGGQTSVFENDALSFETESIEPEEFVQLSLLQHKAPKSVLVLGGGIDGTISELAKFGLEKIDYVDLNRKLIDVSKKHLSEETNLALMSENLKLIIEDPRLYLKECQGYDVILIGASEPSSGQSNRFFTKEFFEQCAAKLNHAGIAAVRLRSAENFWTPQLTVRNASVYKSMKNIFNDVIVLPGSTNILIGSENNLEKNPLILSERFKERKIQARLVSPQFINYIFTNDRFFYINHIISTSRAELNSDLRPVCYQYSAAVWLSKFFPGLMQFDILTLNKKLDVKKAAAVSILLLAVILLFIRKAKLRIGRILLVFIAGFTGMIFETMLILFYQSRSGILYQNIGILLTAFMAGLSLGSIAVDKFYHLKNGNLKVFNSAGIVLLILIGFLNISFGKIISINFFSSLTGTSFLLIIAGALAAGVFAYASLHLIDNQQKIVAPLYSADVLGGSLGSLLSTFILIPFLGIVPTGIFLGILSFLSLILI